MKWEPDALLQPVKKPKITREQLRAYAEASGDTNPIHLDEDFAREAGMPSVIAHGMISMAFLGDLIARNFPQDEYRLTRFRTRFRKITFPGDELTCEGRIKAVSPDGTLEVAVWTRNQNGQVTTDGEARLQPLS